MTSPSLPEVIERLCAERGAGKTICPTEAAKEAAKAMTPAASGDQAWRVWLPKVRHAAVALAREGRIAIYRKGKPADPDTFRGVYRLGLPPEE